MNRNVPLRSTTGLSRNVPLLRTSRLEPGPPPQRNMPLRMTAGRMTASRAGEFPAAGSGVPKPKSAARRETGFSRAVKLAVRTRAGNGEIENAACEHCGIWLGRYGGQVQHLVARGMGGTSDPVLGTAANGALLCGTAQSGDHGLAESRDREIGARGFWLPQGTDPRMVPMMLGSEHGSGVLVWRSEDGRYLFEAPEVSAA
jgi:hypothetical protein